MKLELRFPASPENAADHAQLAVQVARAEYEEALDFSPGSLEDVDQHIESLREQGLNGEDVAELLRSAKLSPIKRGARVLAR